MCIFPGPKQVHCVLFFCSLSSKRYLTRTFNGWVPWACCMVQFGKCIRISFWGLFLKIRATLAYFLCVWHLTLGPFRLGPCWPGDVVSTADVCAKTTKMLWWSCHTCWVSTVTTFGGQGVRRCLWRKIKCDDVYATLILSPSIVARGRRDRAHACCSVLLWESSCEFPSFSGSFGTADFYRFSLHIL